MWYCRYVNFDPVQVKLCSTKTFMKLLHHSLNSSSTCSKLNVFMQNYVNSNNTNNYMAQFPTEQTQCACSHTRTYTIYIY